MLLYARPAAIVWRQASPAPAMPPAGTAAPRPRWELRTRGTHSVVFWSYGTSGAGPTPPPTGTAAPRRPWQLYIRHSSAHVFWSRGSVPVPPVAPSDIYVPTADVTDGTWTATPTGDLYSRIDEGLPANLTDYISSPVPGATDVVMAIGPLPPGTYQISVTAATNFGASTLTVALLDNSLTELGSASQALTSTPTAYTLDVTVAGGTATRVSLSIA